MRRRSGRHKENPPQIETLLRGAGHGKVSAMNGIESAAEQCDVQRRQFPVSGFEFQEKNER
jgi:hypothetical protein